MLSVDERSPTLSEHPLFAHIFRLLDQLLVQVRRTRMLLFRTYDAIDQIPTNVRPMYSEWHRGKAQCGKTAVRVASQRSGSDAHPTNRNGIEAGSQRGAAMDGTESNRSGCSRYHVERGPTEFVITYGTSRLFTDKIAFHRSIGVPVCNLLSVV